MQLQGVQLTPDQGVASSSLTSVTALSLSKTQLCLLITGSNQEDPFRHNWKIVDWEIKNQIRQTHCMQHP